MPHQHTNLNICSIDFSIKVHWMICYRGHFFLATNLHMTFRYTRQAFHKTHLRRVHGHQFQAKMMQRHFELKRVRHIRMENNCVAARSECIENRIRCRDVVAIAYSARMYDVDGTRTHINLLWFDTAINHSETSAQWLPTTCASWMQEMMASVAVASLSALTNNHVV